ncbi:hypothetical protein Tco_1104730 [Tanacetum coccineum]
MVTGVPGQEGADGNVAEKKKVKESKKANLGKLLKYNVWSTRWSQDIRSKFKHSVSCLLLVLDTTHDLAFCD